MIALDAFRSFSRILKLVMCRLGWYCCCPGRDRLKNRISSKTLVIFSVTTNFLLPILLFFLHVIHNIHVVPPFIFMGCCGLFCRTLQLHEHVLCAASDGRRLMNFDAFRKIHWDWQYPRTKTVCNSITTSLLKRKRRKHRLLAYSDTYLCVHV